MFKWHRYEQLLLGEWLLLHHWSRCPTRQPWPLIPSTQEQNIGWQGPKMSVGLIPCKTGITDDWFHSVDSNHLMIQSANFPESSFLFHFLYPSFISPSESTTLEKQRKWGTVNLALLVMVPKKWFTKNY